MEPSDEQLNEAAAKVVKHILDRIDPRDSYGKRFSPATDIADAMMLADAMRRKFWWVTIEGSGTTGWHVTFSVKGIVKVTETSDELPRAITKAATRVTMEVSRAAGIEVAALGPAPVAGGEKE